MIVTHPGKLGDLFWSLSTAGELSKQHGQVDFLTSAYCRGVLPILRGQPYIKSAEVLETWRITGDCPGLQPWNPPLEGAVHLGMRKDEWPTPTIFDYTARLGGVSPDPLSPWISRSQDCPESWRNLIGVSFTDEYAGLKAGVVFALASALKDERFMVLLNPGSRMEKEFEWCRLQNVGVLTCTLEQVWKFLPFTKFLITCKSSVRVLAYGMGIPTLVVEPSPPRHNPVFDPPSPCSRELILNLKDDFDSGLVDLANSMLWRLEGK